MDLDVLGPVEQMMRPDDDVPTDDEENSLDSLDDDPSLRMCIESPITISPDELTQALEMSNLIFTFLFGIEMALKILAEGCFHYISDGFNVFDGIVVLVSIMELIEDSGSGLSVLRTFRLLRILKLVRFMPALKRQLVIMLRTLDNVAVFFALLVLFIFIFR
uniref:Ion transport domain-containing protein n=1 Tax=Tetranychus urticae TaxID=32264 RepID=T1JU89_TETUR